MRQTRRRHTSIAAFAIVSALVIASCGGDDDDATDDAATTEADAGAATTAAAAETTAAAADTTEAAAETTEAAGSDTTAAAGGGGDLEQLAADCAEEGNKVNLIALPDEWANYKGILAELPREVPGRRATRSRPRTPRRVRRWRPSRRSPVRTTCPTASTSARPSPRRWSTPACSSRTSRPSIDEIPEGLVDVDNNWTAAYYGIMAISTNTHDRAERAEDVRRPDRSPSTRAWSRSTAILASRVPAFAAVMAASLANGGSADDIMPGIEFFAELKASGNLGRHRRHPGDGAVG